MRVGKLVKAVGGLAGHHLLLLARGEHHPVFLTLELRARQRALKSDLHIAVHIPIRLQSELSGNDDTSDLELYVMQFRTRKTVLHSLQFLRRDDDAHLFELLKFQVGGVEADLFELIRSNLVLAECFETLGVLGIVDEPYERLGQLAGLVGSNFQKTERLGVLLRHEAFDEGCGDAAVAQVVEGRLVGRERLRRGDFVLVVLLLEFGNGLYGTVLLVVEQKCLLVLGIGLFWSLNRLLILIFFGHKAKCF